MSAMFAHRLTGPLASLDETGLHVQETIKSWLTKDWYVLEYGSSVWDPKSIFLQDELTKI